MAMKFTPKTKIYTRESALEKMKAYCAQEERCHQDIDQKLRGYGVYPDDREEVIAELISEGFLNETRYAIAFAQGKLRQNQWGRKKIEMALKQKGLSTYCIQAGLQSLDEKDYLESLQKVLQQRDRATKEIHPKQRAYKLIQYAISRGFEYELAAACLSNMDLDTTDL